ncbi:hypothetical protein CU669_17245 [Paramagnetospirillum kuznetsovii]|uniref:Uncharacterized protein n=1 Tax=Paramagnetospirillum kuznetsovii TaxID=2053833 RepID=A0A364NUE1_9PROT|nr:hypothetical protein [Paramagnetospirillum kuznetsovii]RAU20686.1 hypothetical protein CU669_17245 [Paramagnetospirillum kuznetsovii]
MLAVSAFTESRNSLLRCGACRYFTHERCCNSTARLDGEDQKTGECPYFRFAQSHAPTFY